MTLDLNKPVQTRDGRKARILGPLAGGPDRIAVAVTIGDMEFAEARYSDGMYLNGKKSLHDLINVPEERWVNVYRDNTHECLIFASREEADRFVRCNGVDRIACLKFTEGEGL